MPNIDPSLIKLNPVSHSSNIKAIGYDEDSQILVVQFLDGGKYKYEAVPPQIYKDFLRSQSMGKYFHASIKGKFKAEKMTPDPLAAQK